MEENFEAVEERKEFEEVMTEKAKDRTPLMVTAAAVVVGSAVMYMGYLVGARVQGFPDHLFPRFLHR